MMPWWGWLLVSLGGLGWMLLLWLMLVLSKISLWS
jgi:hypothetical protein